jgi:superfamily I DNA/RNA helicase
MEDLFKSSEIPLVNGMIGYVTAFSEDVNNFNLDELNAKFARLSFKPDFAKSDAEVYEHLLFLKAALINGDSYNFKDKATLRSLIAAIKHEKTGGVVKKPRRPGSIKLLDVFDDGESSSNEGIDFLSKLANSENPYREDYATLDDLDFNYFNYGYAITTHAAQGSQWKKVLVVEERLSPTQEMHNRWLYTAVTRSEDRLVILK